MPFLIFHYYTIIVTQIINNFLPFFWRYISFLRYFLGISLSFSFVTFSKSFWQFFYFLIFRYYTILILFLIFFLEICFSLGISLSLSFITVSELFCCEFFKTFVILKQHIYHFFFFKFILSKRLSNSLWG